MHRVLITIWGAFFLSTAAHAEQPKADERLPAGQCAYPAKNVENAPPIELAPVEVSAKHTETSREKALFQGNVEFQQGPRSLTAETVELDRTNGKMRANGDIHYSDELLTVSGDSIEADAANNAAKLEGTVYHLNGRQGRGKAGSLEVDESNSLTLKEATFTTCPPGDSSWRIRAEKIRLDNEKEMGETHSTWLYLGNVPVAYVPYFTFPISNKRKSGFLYPHVSTKAKYGFEVAAPYYIDIAPQMDATITPRYMQTRGAQLITEMRYMTENQRGELNLEYMGKDKEFSTNDARYLVNLEHAINYQQHWRAYGKFTEVSDNNYLNDLGSKVASSTNNRLERRLDMGYYDSNWWISTKVTNYKILGDAIEPYSTQPAVDFFYSIPDTGFGSNFSIVSELTRFDHSETTEPNATRWHIEPSLILPIRTASGGVDLEARLYHTMFNQDDTNNELASSTSRTLPYLRAYGNLNFERETSLFDSNFTQTLEPQIQYLYVPYKDQADIGIYDSNELQYDYDALFRDRRFVGYDRIADANQATWGLSTRMLDHSGKEHLKFSLGQIFYFSDSKVQQDDAPGLEKGQSALASEFDLLLATNWYLHNRVQYDIELNELNKNEVLLDYRPDDARRLQLSYRRVPQITPTQAIDQVGIVGAWPISDSMQFVGSYYQDLELDRQLEAYAGLQYETCCYALRFGYHRHLNTNFADPNDPTDQSRKEYDSGFFFKIVVKGLGSEGGLDYEEMLRSSLFGDLNRYYLNN